MISILSFLAFAAALLSAHALSEVKTKSTTEREGRAVL